MRYISITDNPVLLESFRHFPESSDSSIIIHHGKENFRVLQTHKWKAGFSESSRDISDTIRLKANDRVLFHYIDRQRFTSLLEIILRNKANFQGIVVQNSQDEILHIEDNRISSLTIREILGGNLNLRWDYISTSRKVKTLQSLFDSAKNVLVLTQHDPDPDAIASALALRTLLNRNRTTAPIGSFGKITWNENLAMARLLDIEIIQVDTESIRQFDKIAVVDAQPHYFNGLNHRFDAVIDHHPRIEVLKLPFTDIQTSYGATSTILTEYLVASKTNINQRLATALLYGIKTDTLFLGREVSVHDFEAFKTVWPLANHNLLRKMERPELGADEIASFTKALKNREVFGRALYTFLGVVGKEDIIPRLADFCLQVGGIDWSMVAGINSGNIIISVRNIGIPRSAGILVNKLFGHLGSAGGHGSMAKAVVPLKDFKKTYKADSMESVSNQIMKLFQEELAC